MWTRKFLKKNFFFSRSEKWKKNLFSFYKKSLILRILVNKKLFFFLIFFHVKRKIQKNLFSFHMRKEKFLKIFFFFSWKKKNWKKKFFSRNAKCEISYFFSSFRDHFENKKSRFFIFFCVFFDDYKTSKFAIFNENNLY